MKHKHHIIPRHMGGTDDESNLIELTVEEHAEAHRKLWEEFGKPEDKLAWYMLSGKKEEGEKLRVELAVKRFREWKENNPEKEKEWRKKISNTLKGKRYLPDSHYKELGDMRRGKKRPDYVGRKISESKKGVSVPQPNQRKTYEVVKPNGEVCIVVGLNKFCKEEGIDAGNLCAVAKGRLKHYKGYKARLVM